MLQQFMKERNHSNVIFVIHTNIVRKDTLNSHVTTVHVGKKQFKCDICKTDFGRKYTLNNHIEAIHEGKKQFKCEICDTRFTSKHVMKGHIATIHEGKKRNQMRHTV